MRVSTSYSMELEKFFVALDYGRWIEEQRLKKIRERIGGKAGLLFDRPSTSNVLDGNMSFDARAYGMSWSIMLVMIILISVASLYYLWDQDNSYFWV